MRRQATGYHHFEMSPSERRRQDRFKKDAPLILIRPGMKEQNSGAILRDVSLGGLAFETDFPLEQGHEFTFALYVPSRGWVDGSGRVCWSKAEGNSWLCGASISIRRWDQEKLLRKWLHNPAKGLLRFFFPEP